MGAPPGNKFGKLAKNSGKPRSLTPEQFEQKAN